MTGAYGWVNRTRLRPAIGAAALFLLFTAFSAGAGSEYKPRIPQGYASQVVLHLDYGSTPDKILVDWGTPGPDGSGPSSADNLQIVGNRFYLMDISSRIRQYRSPGTLVWETQSMTGLRDYAVAPDGRVYAIWSHGRLSCFDNRAKLLWTKTREEVVPYEKLKEFGLSAMLPGFYAVKGWANDGLVVTIGGWLDSGAAENVALLIDTDGKLVRPLPGSLVGSDGMIYRSLPDAEGTGPLPPPLIGTDLEGHTQRRVTMSFGADRAVFMAGNPTLGPTLPDPTGGFAVHAYADLPKGTAINRRTQLREEEVMWRFDVHGKIREEWRFIRSIFRYENEIVIGPDGCVYHLRFGDKGLDVVKYAKRKVG